MPYRYIHPLILCLLLPLLGTGCASLQGATVEDNRLDTLAEKLDQSLTNQAAVDRQLQEQRQQLQLQQAQLQALGRDVGLALQDPIPENCPEVSECPALDATGGKIVVGGLEEIWLSELDLAVTARIDTGLQTSSLDARNIEHFERDGKPWVRFEIRAPDTGEPLQVERRLKRTVGIVKSGSSESIRRPVVSMGVVIGNITQMAEFTLSERTRRGYQAQLGRSILNDVILVDVSRKNIAPYQLPETTAAGVEAAR